MKGRRVEGKKGGKVEITKNFFGCFTVLVKKGRKIGSWE
jgi:hypothetical protein